MKEAQAPDNDRFGFRTRRVAWALGISAAVHLVFVGTIVRFPPARAAALPTPQPIGVFTPAPPIVLPTNPPPTPTPPPPTPPPHVNPPTPPPRPVSAHVPLARRPRGVAVRPVPLHERQDSTIPSTAHAGPPGNDMSGPAVLGSGAPTATGAPGPVQTAAPTAPPPTETPKPSCAIPDVDAHSVSVVEPEESDLAKERDETGATRIRVDLDLRGAVIGTSIETSSGFGDLDRAAIAAAQQSRFAPQIHDCIAVGGSYLFIASFEE